MKKIIAITAMAATMAAFSFGVELSGQVKVGGEVMSLSGGNFTAIKGGNGADSDDTKFAASVSAEKAGASITIANGGTFKDASVWVSPVDGLKFTLGKVKGASIANPNFDWWASTACIDDNGFQVSFAKDALGVSLTGKVDPVLNTGKSGIDMIGPMFLECNYNVEGIGKFQLAVGKDASIGSRGFMGSTPALTVGLAYANMPYGQTGFYGDAFVSFAKDGDALKFASVDSQIGGQFAMDAFMIQLTNVINYSDSFHYGFALRTSYSLGAVTPYLAVTGYNIMDGSLFYSWNPAPESDNVCLELGLDTSVDGCGINVAIQSNIDFDNYSFNFAVPVSFTMAL